MNNFFANLYELWGLNYLGTFSDDLFNLGIYPIVFFLSLGVALVIIFTYYKLLDRPRFSKFYVWSIAVLLIVIITGFIAYNQSDTAIYNLYYEQGQDVPYGIGDFITFAITNMLIYLIITFLLSMLLKFSSTNHKYIPF